MNIIELQDISKSNELIWKVADFYDKRSNDEFVMSEKSYNSNCGYHFQFKVNLDGKSNSGNISIFS